MGKNWTRAGKGAVRAHAEDLHAGFESSALERQRSIPLASDPDLMELLDRVALPGRGLMLVQLQE